MIDTHAHLEEIADLAQALTAAKTAGLEAVIAVAQDIASGQRLLEICREHDDILKIYPALGVHPGRAEDCDPDNALNFIEENISRIVAIGEIGLDYWYRQARKTGPGRQRQKDVFERQLLLAKKYDKPVVVHSRGAWEACLTSLISHDIEQAEFHWYSGPEDILGRLLERGYFISATPAAEYSLEHRRALSKAPLERILLETDSPVRYKPAQGEYQAQPKDVFRALEALAELKNVSLRQAAETTQKSAKGFFKLP